MTLHDFALFSLALSPSQHPPIAHISKTAPSTLLLTERLPDRLVVVCLQQRDLFSRVTIDEVAFVKFLRQIEAGYRNSNPYHNRSAFSSIVACPRRSKQLSASDCSAGLGSSTGAELSTGNLLLVYVQVQWKPPCTHFGVLLVPLSNA